MSTHPARFRGPFRVAGRTHVGTAICMAFLAGCTWISKTEYESQASLLDQDGDGISLKDGDCDPEDGNVFPGAEEIWYDGIDGDCAGDDDYDQDGDGYQAFSEGGDDCDDTDPLVTPENRPPSDCAPEDTTPRREDGKGTGCATSAPIGFSTALLAFMPIWLRRRT